MIRRIDDADRKQEIARRVLEALPEWFGIAEAREQYIADSRTQLLFAAFESEQPVGFICLKETGAATAEIAVLGVMKTHQRRGVGRALFTAARDAAAAQGYSFLQVKTLRMGVCAEYDATNRFYLSVGFQEFEVFPTLWDEGNPCQIYVLSLR